MSRSNGIKLAIALATVLVVGVAAGVAWARVKHSVDVKHVYIGGINFISVLESLPPESAATFLSDEVTDVDDVLPTLTIISGQLQADLAIAHTFGEGLPDRPLPALDAELAKTIEFENEFAFLGVPPNRLIFVRSENGYFELDRRPFVNGPTLEQAEAMRSSLTSFADRVWRNEFETREDALAAYQTATFRGLLAGVAASATTRPAGD